MDGPFGLHTRVASRLRWISQVPLCFHFQSCHALRPRRGLQQPSPICRLLTIAFQVFDLVGPRIILTRLNRFTCITARLSLCLRLTHVVTSTRSRLDSWWIGFILAKTGISPVESTRLFLAHQRSHECLHQVCSSPCSLRFLHRAHPTLYVDFAPA